MTAIIDATCDFSTLAAACITSTTTITRLSHVLIESIRHWNLGFESRGRGSIRGLSESRSYIKKRFLTLFLTCRRCSPLTILRKRVFPTVRSCLCKNYWCQSTASIDDRVMPNIRSLICLQLFLVFNILYMPSMVLLESLFEARYKFVMIPCPLQVEITIAMLYYFATYKGLAVLA